MELKNQQTDTLLNDIALGAATGTLTTGNFGTPTTGIYLTFDYDVAAKYEVKLVTVAGSAMTGMSHVSGANVAHTAGCKIGRMMNAEIIDDLKNADIDGWVDPKETWAYASATTITVPTGAASRYSVGDKLKLTQTTVKYFYVTAVADTVLTVTGGTDYTVANAAITANYYSKASSPVGFPYWFNWTPTLASSGGTAPTYTAAFVNKFRISDRCVFLASTWNNASGGTAGSGAAAITMTMPVTAATLYTASEHTVGHGRAYEDGGTGGFVEVVLLSTSSIGFFLSAYAPIVANDQSSADRRIHFNGFYQI